MWRPWETSLCAEKTCPEVRQARGRGARDVGAECGPETTGCCRAEGGGRTDEGSGGSDSSRTTFPSTLSSTLEPTLTLRS